MRQTLGLAFSVLILVFAGCESKDESKGEVQAIVEMISQAASAYMNEVNQGGRQRISQPAGEDLASTSVPNRYVVQVDMPFFNKPLPGFGGSAVLNGNMHLIASDTGQINGNFMITATFNQATWGEFVINGSLTDTGTISGNVYSEVNINFSTVSSLDFTVNGHSHSINVRTTFNVTQNGGAGQVVGIIDHETVSFPI